MGEEGVWCGCGCGCVGVWVLVWVWVCGCVGVWVCGCVGVGVWGGVGWCGVGWGGVGGLGRRRWWWCGRCACMTCLSMPHSSHAMSWVAGHLRVRLPATPPPLPRPNGGGQNLALCLCTGPCQLTLSKLHEACSTCTTGMWTTSSMNCNWGSSMICFNSQDPVNLPLRHDRDVNDIRPRNDLTCGAAQQGRQTPYQ